MHIDQDICFTKLTWSHTWLQHFARVSALTSLIPPSKTHIQSLCPQLCVRWQVRVCGKHCVITQDTMESPGQARDRWWGLLRPKKACVLLKVIGARAAIPRRRNSRCKKAQSWWRCQGTRLDTGAFGKPFIISRPQFPHLQNGSSSVCLFMKLTKVRTQV